MYVIIFVCTTTSLTPACFNFGSYLKATPTRIARKRVQINNLNNQREGKKFRLQELQWLLHGATSHCLQPQVQWDLLDFTPRTLTHIHKLANQLIKPFILTPKSATGHLKQSSNDWLPRRTGCNAADSRPVGTIKIVPTIVTKSDSVPGLKTQPKDKLSYI